MRLVGDDVVDLDDPAIESSHLRERFVARVCHESERALLAALPRAPWGESPRADGRHERRKSPLSPWGEGRGEGFHAPDKVLLWSLFAAKEAAFKAVSRPGPPPVFAHRRFVVSADLRCIRYGELELELRVAAGDGWVHAVAWRSAEVPRSGVGVVAPREEPGVAARQLLIDHLGGDVEIRRPPRPGSWDGYGPPVVLRHGARVGINVSLSHDGRFASFAAVG